MFSRLNFAVSLLALITLLCVGNISHAQWGPRWERFMTCENDAVRVDKAPAGYNRYAYQLVLRKTDAIVHFTNLGIVSRVGKWQLTPNGAEWLMQSNYVKWNSLFKTYSFNGVLIVANPQGNTLLVEGYTAGMLNEDDGYLNPSTIRKVGEYRFYNCGN